MATPKAAPTLRGPKKDNFESAIDQLFELEEAAESALPDDILPTEADDRLQETPLSRPSEINLFDRRGAEKKRSWLGWNMGASVWPGYFRIGFAADVGNVATLDIHKEDHPALTEALVKALGGSRASVRFEEGGEWVARTNRKSASAMLIEPAEPYCRITVLDMEFERLGEVLCTAPDMKRGIELMLRVMPTIENAPTRRALRRVAGPSEEQMPDGLIEPIPLEADLRARLDDRFQDVRLKLTGASVHMDDRVSTVDEVAWDFGEYPPLMAISMIDSLSGQRSIIVHGVSSADLDRMDASMQADLWNIRQSGLYRIECPRETRVNIVETLRPLVEEFETTAKPRHYRAAQYPLQLEGGTPIPARRARIPVALTPEAQAASEAPRKGLSGTSGSAEPTESRQSQVVGLQYGSR